MWNASATCSAGNFASLARGRERAKHLRLGGVDGGVTLLLLCDRIGGAQIGLAHIQHRLLDRSVIVRREVAWLLGGLLGQTDNRLNDRLECGVASHHRFQHRLLGELPSFRFNHQHRVRRTGDDKVEGRILHLLDGRVHLDLVLDEARLELPPIGPMNGTPESVSAAEEAIIARMSESVSRS